MYRLRWPEKHVWIIAMALALVMAIGVGAWVFKPKAIPAHLYLQYSESEISALKGLAVEEEVTVDRVGFWDQVAFTMVRDHKLADVESSRIYAYLTAAQRDYLALGQRLHGRSVGSIDELSRQMLCLFFVDDCVRMQPWTKPDAYSSKAAALITSKYKQRLSRDVGQRFVLRPGDDLWQGKQPLGVDVRHRLAWNARDAAQFRAEPPPATKSAKYREQLRLTREALANLNDEERTKVVYWSGGPGSKTVPGIWLMLMDRYAVQEDLPVETYINASADLTMAMADAISAVYDSKYAFQVKRPIMLDPSMATAMPTASSPSYPSAHAAVSYAAATVLERYFPQQKQVWRQQAREATDSRVWAGVQFPLDGVAGQALGEQVGANTLRTSNATDW